MLHTTERRLRRASHARAVGPPDSGAFRIRTMPSVARRRMWGEGERSSRYPKPLTNPKARNWSPPKPPKMPKRSPTIVDVDWRPALLAQAEGWEAEARKMEIAIDESGALYGHSGGTDENADASVGDSKSENARPDFLPIEIDLGQLLLKTDKFSMGSKSSRKQLEQQLREWDKSRDGSISKGEFRLHLRKLGFRIRTTRSMRSLTNTMPTALGRWTWTS